MNNNKTIFISNGKVVSKDNSNNSSTLFNNIADPTINIPNGGIDGFRSGANGASSCTECGGSIGEGYCAGCQDNNDCCLLAGLTDDSSHGAVLSIPAGYSTAPYDGTTFVYKKVECGTEEEIISVQHISGPQSYQMAPMVGSCCSGQCLPFACDDPFAF